MRRPKYWHVIILKGTASVPGIKHEREEKETARKTVAATVSGQPMNFSRPRASLARIARWRGRFRYLETGILLKHELKINIASINLRNQAAICRAPFITAERPTPSMRGGPYDGCLAVKKH